MERAQRKKLKTVFERTLDGGFAFESKMPQNVQNSIKNVLKQKLVLSYVQIIEIPGLEDIKKIYSWFKNKLVVLTPTNRLVHFTDKTMPINWLSS